MTSGLSTRRSIITVAFSPLGFVVERSYIGERLFRTSCAVSSAAEYVEIIVDAHIVIVNSELSMATSPSNILNKSQFRQKTRLTGIKTHDRRSETIPIELNGHCHGDIMTSPGHHHFA